MRDRFAGQDQKCECWLIMVTAAEDLDTARRALASGAADYLTKPFTFQYLDAVLDIHMTPDWMALRPMGKSRLAAQLNGQVVAEAASMGNAQHVIAAL